MKTILSIAGSDCSGGAGIQADIKTITAHKKYAMTVITALTAQNTNGVFGVLETSPDFVAKQIDVVFEDIFPDAIKIGMVANPFIIEIIAEKLLKYKAKNIVLDPVMISTSGSKLLNENAMSNLITKLIPIANIITPNIAEAEVLCGFSINDKNKMQDAATEIAKFTKAAILIKGGHLKNSADDLLLYKGEFIWFDSEKIDNPNNHGTGCTLSSAIACNLSENENLIYAVKNAKEYVREALLKNLNLGKGSGPLNHCVF